ncbi:hypothetical protein ASA1KI_15690 [Opitutales bacterium ASA1]|uniref:uroporphyrinogen decarboxylase family protein n=1 Tax=Congregicoccus parvus TaxID=3081749 RepID=UPI002B2D3C00|nr:hypothetical protein ASA1KI_15690 [Opitutales bacterium ASA1]
MSREFFLSLAAAGHATPIATDLVLHEERDPEAVVHDGQRLAGVVTKAANAWRTPLALPLMDLALEKAWLVSLLGGDVGSSGGYRLEEPIDAERAAVVEERIANGPLSPRLRVQAEQVRCIARARKLFPVGMTIGPYSLATKLLADPITATFLAGSGLEAEDEPEVALIETASRLAAACVRRNVGEQLQAGARAIFVAEPAANRVFISPRQMAEGSDVFTRFVLEPNRLVARAIAEAGAELVFHCCGEVEEAMLEGFCGLRPAMLSLGSSRDLAKDAEKVPRDIVLYGNLPSKRFVSGDYTAADVRREAAGLVERMRATGHPFILGTECDTLWVEGAASEIREKVEALLRAARR